MSFSAQIAAFKIKAEQAMNDSVCKAAESLFTSIVELSPSPPGKGNYSKGTIKNSWYASVNGFDLTVGGLPSGTGGESLSRIKTLLKSKPFLGKDGFITLTNSTKYINWVENVGWPLNHPDNKTGWAWTGNIGPYAMVKTSVTMWKAKY